MKKYTVTIHLVGGSVITLSPVPERADDDMIYKLKGPPAIIELGSGGVVLTHFIAAILRDEIEDVGK